MRLSPTSRQLELALKLGIDVRRDTEAVAGARILAEVGDAIGQPRSAHPATKPQMEFATKLGIDVSADALVVASAKIADALYQRNLAALSRLGLKPGDSVVRRRVGMLNGESVDLSERAIVSSVRPNLRVFFKGGNGRGAWPSELERV